MAAQTGLRSSAIRYYERAGLLPEPERVGGQRRYTDDVVRRLGVIAVAKRAGFSLDDARILLAATDGGDPVHEPLRALAERKLPEIEALIDRAEQVKRWLEVAQGCGCETLEVCALFDEQPSARDNDPEARFGLVHVAARDAPVSRS